MKPAVALVLVVALGVGLLVAAVIPPPPIVITYVYSPDAQDLLEGDPKKDPIGLLDEFNRADIEVDGRAVEVVGQPENSGTAMLKIASGQESPTLWTPAASIWGDLLTVQDQGLTSPSWLREPLVSTMSLVTSPQVLAIWCSEAARHGWAEREGTSCVRTKAPSWDEIMSLSQGTTDADEPVLNLGHTNPEISTSGVFALLSEYYAVAGSDLLMASDVTDPTARAEVAATERSIVHYGPTSAAFRPNLCDHAQSYLSAVYLQETTVVVLNQDEKCRKNWGEDDQLIALYPADGTFVADYPIYVLPGADDDQLEAVEKLRRYLGDKATATKVAEFGYRGRPEGGEDSAVGEAASPVDADHGVDPRPPAAKLLPVPEPLVVRTAQNQWVDDRKPARIALVVDVSGSMANGQRLDAVKEGLNNLVNELGDEDQFALLTFADDVSSPPILPMGTRKDREQEIRNAIEDLTVKGKAALYDAIWAGYSEIAAGYDPTKINAVIVVTDSADNASTTIDYDTLKELVAWEKPGEQPLIPVYTVALTGADADPDVDQLKEISEITYAESFSEGPEAAIIAAFHNIPSYF